MLNSEVRLTSGIYGIYGPFIHCIKSIVHPENFRSNTQNANAFARRNRPHVDRNDEFVCVYLRLHSFASIVRDRPCARTCVRPRARTYIYIGKVWAWHYLR